MQNVQCLYCNSHSVPAAAATRRRNAAGDAQLVDANNLFAAAAVVAAVAAVAALAVVVAAAAVGRNPDDRYADVAAAAKPVEVPAGSEGLPNRC